MIPNPLDSEVGASQANRFLMPNSDSQLIPDFSFCSSHQEITTADVTQ